MNENTQIRRYDVFSCENGYFTERSLDGSLIYVEDLVYWIQCHVREGNINNVYTDLLAALAEKGE